jgi:hypothetical protein
MFAASGCERHGSVVVGDVETANAVEEAKSIDRRDLKRAMFLASDVVMYGS